MKINYKGSIFPMFDSLRNSFIGKLQHPHTHFIEKGCHAITFVTHGNDGKANESNTRIMDFMAILEKFVRITDQLDEQLHAGFYFYIIVSPSKFISNSGFIWPIVCLMFGIFVPHILEYSTHL
jgi:hypothetical protein